MGISGFITIPCYVEKILPHQKFINGKPFFLEQAENDVPVNLLIENHTPHRPVFLLFELERYLPASSLTPVLILQIYLVHFHKVLRQLICKFPTLRAVRHNRQKNKFNLRKILYHAVYPPGYPAYHIGITSLRDNTYSHLFHLFSFLPRAKMNPQATADNNRAGPSFHTGFSMYPPAPG